LIFFLYFLLEADKFSRGWNALKMAKGAKSVPDDVGVVVLVDLAQETDLPEGGHGHSILCEGHPHLLQGHKLARGMQVTRLPHRPVRPCNKTSTLSVPGKATNFKRAVRPTGYMRKSVSAPPPKVPLFCTRQFKF